METAKPQRVNLPLGDDQPAPAAPEVPAGASLEERVLAALRTVYDPEIPVNIYDLGLIYDLKIDPSGAVAIRMTLTSPACPVAESLPGQVRARVESIPDVTTATVDLVWEPPWDHSRMSEAAQLQLGFF